MLANIQFLNNHIFKQNPFINYFGFCYSLSAGSCQADYLTGNALALEWHNKSKGLVALCLSNTWGLRKSDTAIIMEVQILFFIFLQVSEQHEKESSLMRELQRLRGHLEAVEVTYTQEMVKAEQQVQELTQRLTLAEERAKSSSTAYTSAR